MYEKNKSELEKSRLLEYLNAGYTGKGKCIVVLDDAGLPNSFQNIEMPFKHHTNGKINHKTLVCSCIREILPDVRIVAMNWFSYPDECTEWIELHRAEIDAINCSFHSPKDSNKELWNRIEKLNIPVVCASGNNSNVWKGGVSYPANLPWTIAVGAFQENNDEVANYSNGGEDLDCVAYSGIWIKNSTQKYIVFDGTSASAPFMSCILVVYSMMRDELVLNKLTGTIAKGWIKYVAKDIYEKGKDYKSGYGILRMPKIDEMHFKSKYGYSAYFDDKVWLK